MRNAAKLLSLLVIFSVCLAVCAYAGAAPAVPGGDGGEPYADYGSEPESSPVPDPEPPVDDGGPEQDAPPAGTETLTVSGGENVTLRDERIAVAGSDPLADGGEGYVNTPDGAAAPPWGLGINGSSQAIVLTGREPGLTLLGTDVSAAGWGALSVGGQDAQITAVDADLSILSAGSGGMDPGVELLGYDRDDLGSGYGSCLTGGASQYFYGSAVSGATYGAVLNGADTVWYGSSDGTVLLYDGAALAGSVRGLGRRSSIDSVFGFMMCGDVTGGVTVEDGTKIHSADATVLYKDGSGVFTFNNARLSSDSGVLFQMMDNDDDGRIGLLTDTYSLSPVYDERNVGGAPGFPTAGPDTGEDTHPTGAEDPDALPPTAEPRQAGVVYTNGLYSGNIYNGTGYSGQPGDCLTVTVGPGAVLNGDISLTSAVKAIPYSPGTVELLDKMPDIQYCLLNDIGAPCGTDQAAYIQFTRYTIDQYYLQGHVENLPYYNGSASLDVTVAQGGAWAVQDVSVVTSLTVEDGALVYGQVQNNADSSITLIPADQPLDSGVYIPNTEAFAPADQPLDDGSTGEDVPAAEPPRQATVTIGGQDHTLDLHEWDGVNYVRLSDLIALFFGGTQPPGI